LTYNAIRDVHNENPHPSLTIKKIGVKGFHRRIDLCTSTGTFSYDVELNAFIDLPKSQRGAHMSRIIEAMIEVIDDGKRKRFETFEDLLEEICRKLLLKNPYASRAEVEAKTIRYFKMNFKEEEIPEAVNVIFSASMQRGCVAERSISVDLEGLTVCPCAQAVYSDLEKIPSDRGLSHTQRTRISVEVKTNGASVPIEWLVDAAVNAFSAPVLSLLKRPQEYELIKAAFKNPRFIEDAIRHVLFKLSRKLHDEGFPPNTKIIIKGESYESVHPFNAYASTNVTLDEALRELNSE